MSAAFCAKRAVAYVLEGMPSLFTNTTSGLSQFWHPVARIDDLDGPGPHAIRLLGEDFVLVHLGGRWTVAPAACPHRLAPLSAGSIVDDRLQCAYPAAGTCVDIPALGNGATIPPVAHLETPAEVTERYGLVWVALDPPLSPIPKSPEWDDDGFGVAIIPTQTWNASAAQMADNFLDVAHFPFTHLGTIGDPDDLVVGDYEVERDGWTFSAVHHHSSKVLADAQAGGAETFETFDRTMTFRCDAPHHVRLHIDYGDDGDLVLLFFHQPVDDESTTLYCIALAENIADGRQTAEDHIAFQAEVGREDRELLEQIAVKGIPLDPGIEAHTKADKITVELRRILAEIAGL